MFSKTVFLEQMKFKKKIWNFFKYYVLLLCSVFLHYKGDFLVNKSDKFSIPKRLKRIKEEEEEMEKAQEEARKRGGRGQKEVRGRGQEKS